jgi:ATP-dependent Lhr-like helicase
VPLPLGLPAAFTAPSDRPLEGLVRRFARTHGPFVASEVAARFGAPVDRVHEALVRLEADGHVIRGEFRPGGTGREWCDPDVLRRLRRRSLALLRREVEPVDAAALGRFLPAWQGADRPRGDVDALTDAVGRLQGAAVPASILETDLLPARIRSYRPADLDALVASGDVAWVGAGPLGTDDGRVMLVYRQDAAALLPDPADDAPTGEVHDAIRRHLAERGASFWPELVSAVGSADERLLQSALWDLVWAGEVTNDTLAPLRAFVRGGSAKVRAARPGQRPRPGALRRAGPPAGAGRWSLVTGLRQPAPAATQRAHALARQLLDRHGVVTREAVLAEGLPGGFAGIYPVLRAMEDAGQVRRGYFVAGLGAAQFAHPGAVDRLRATRRDADDAGDDPRAPIVLAAADPAQPYGAALPWPDGEGRPARQAGAYVVLVDGAPAAYLERGARTLLTFGADPVSWVDALASLVKDGRLRRIQLGRIDGEEASAHAAADELRAAGFVDGYRGLTLRG